MLYSQLFCTIISYFLQVQKLIIGEGGVSNPRTFSDGDWLEYSANDISIKHSFVGWGLGKGLLPSTYIRICLNFIEPTTYRAMLLGASVHSSGFTNELSQIV